MGSFDCYCALCSGPLGIGCISFGSNKEKALARRRKRVENKRRRLKGEKVLNEDSKEWKDAEKAEDERDKAEKAANVDGDGDQEMQNVDVVESSGEDDGDWEEDGSEEEDWEEGENSGNGTENEEEDEDDDDNSNDGNASESSNALNEDDDEHSDVASQTSELSVPGDFDMAANSRDETSSMYSYYEGVSYDPVKLSKADVQWVDRCRVLAINKELKSKKKAFLSGRGRYSDYFDFNIKSRGKDPKDTGETTHPCYHAYEPEEATPAFPMHEACFKLLTKCLATEKNRKIDKDVLYDVMHQSMEELARNLELDYGPIDGAQQSWECYAGEEWSVTDPVLKPGIEEVVKSMLPPTLFDRPSASRLDLGHKVRQDPLMMLPYDVLHGVCAQLSIKDTIALLNASWHVHDSTRDPAFWRLMIRVHIVSFFWELDGLLQNTVFPDTFDWRGAFQWLNEITKPTFAMEGPLTSIANRRRIWDVCLQLAPLYHEKLNAEAYTEPSDSEATPIFTQAKSLHTPVTMYPLSAANESRDILAQFIRSWSEIGYRACDFDTYWTGSYGGLIGISVTFGSVQRVFGSTNGVQGQSLHIGAGDWIREIKLLVGQMHFNLNKNENDPKAVSDAYITGMVVTLTSGIQKAIKGTSYDRHHRPLTVLPGMHLVGLTGEAAPNGVISRLGLLQVPNPDAPSPPIEPSYTSAQRKLWSPKAAHIHNPQGTSPEAIWSHSTLSVYYFPPPTTPTLPSLPHPDMLPYETHLWPTTLNSLRKPTEISVLQIPDEHGKASILGIGESGTAGPVPAQLWDEWQKVKKWDDLDLWNKKKKWEEGDTRKFVIDTPGGERVTEVHVSKDRGSFKLVTNRGREGSFGDGVEEWDVKKAEEGEVIVGVSVCFGRPGGWGEGLKTWSHWGLSDLGVVTTKISGEEAQRAA